MEEVNSMSRITKTLMGRLRNGNTAVGSLTAGLNAGLSTGLTAGLTAGLSAGLLVCLSPSASAKVSSSEAAKLGGELTPVGAETAGNADGSIPAWDGGITTPPSGYQPGDFHVDPYANDQPLATITAENVDNYRDVLSPGQIAMFERYPDTWSMKVYPTHRSASYPQRIYDAIAANATTAELVDGGNGVGNCGEGVPFPIPQSGVEVVWNHLLRFRGESVSRKLGQVAPTSGGSYTMVMIDDSVLWKYMLPGSTVGSINNRLGLFLQRVTSPARLAGSILLVHETLDQTKEPRKAWVYNPGQRRVRRAPNVAYDNPGTAADGQRTSDQLDVFNGSPDRYDWTLVGKKEMLVPYNCYALHSPELKYDDIIQTGHINPEHLRYEKHRVWVVDGKVKDGTSHVYARRTFFIDEDSWQILVADQFDARDEIWRVSEAYVINYYDQPLIWDTLQVHYDLQNGRYLAFGFNNEGNIEEFDLDLKEADFTPEALRREGRR